MDANNSFIDFIDVWERLCRHHSELFDLTCDEYLHLLSSDMDELNNTVAQKEKLLNQISSIDSRRKKIIGELNVELSAQKSTAIVLEKSSEVIEYFKFSGIENYQHLNKLNLLLIDIIEKIQTQNKKNQIFLNKAVAKLNDLKSSFNGGKRLTTYGPQGKTVTKTIQG
jgi:flagellar biosynthesis/type III secretory pathway chaperone